MVIAAIATFALLLVAWIAAPSGVLAARKAPSTETEAAPALAEAA
jgi:hypothetical protein